LPQTHQRKEKEAFAFFSFFDEEAKTITGDENESRRCKVRHGSSCY